MFRKILIILSLAGTHFVLAVIVIPLTVSRLLTMAASNQAPSLVVELLIWTTRILYFPIISLSLYSRKWFPGDFIYVPLASNSLLWGIAGFCVVLMIKKIFRRTISAPPEPCLRA